MIKLVAFDWNGTLLADTKPTIEAEILALKDVGFRRKITIRSFQATFAIPVSRFWVNLGLKPEFLKNHAAEIQRAYVAHYEPREKKALMRTGAKQTLFWLKKNNISSVIYSNHVVPHIWQKLRHFGLKSAVDEVIGRPSHDEMSQLYKRSKDKLLKAYIDKKHIRPHEVLTVGDTEEEIETGKKFGYRTVGITGGWNSADRLRRQKPDFIIRSLPGLVSVIKKIHANK